ncbi:MAG: DNA mismatch repair protein MutS [Planctomycetota bacterium]|nr:DNA mismatch repair protein MutS [Planctomycetota bacterium]
MTTQSAQSDPIDPQKVYEERRERNLADQKELEATDGRFAAARGFVFLVALVLGWYSLFDGSLSPAWLFAPAGTFVVLIIAHSRSIKRLQRKKRAVACYEQGLNRLDDRWQGQGVTGQRYRDPDHPCSSDLDLFGEASLFELVCGARTRLGEDTLASWFSTGTDAKSVLQRQKSIAELRENIDFHESLALLDADVHDDLDQNQLQQWVAAAARPVSLWRRVSACVLGLLAVLSIVAWGAGYGLSPLLIVVLLEIIFFATMLKEIRQNVSEADAAGSGLAILSQVLELIEQQRFSTPLLSHLSGTLQTEGHPPSWQILRIRNMIQTLNNCLQNQFFGPIAFLLGVPVHAVHRIEIWRETIGPHIPEWLDAVGQIEALSSLARYSFEHPDDPFPEVIDESQGPVYLAEELGHPLIETSKCIRNEIRIDSQQRLIMISGSNMSGKSTLLRTVGINAVLALCGAPVRARSLRISPFVVGTAMRVNDSLQHGASLFYSVISRIKSLVERSGQSPPLLFLLDEILQGTNSHDRRVGAEGIIRQLVDSNAVGFVTTHDLALTDIVDSFDGLATNIHFEDHLINGTMYFDYRIRSGVVQKSNALELMRMIGLNVGEDNSVGENKSSP